MYREREGLPPRLARAAMGATGGRRGDGEMRSTQDAVLVTRAEIRRLGAEKSVRLRDGGAKGQEGGSHAEKPRQVGRG